MCVFFFVVLGFYQYLQVFGLVFIFGDTIISQRKSVWYILPQARRFNLLPSPRTQAFCF